MGCTQISVSGILTVPEHKPDIESILRISTTAIIDKTITMRKKIFFSGHVDICVEYAACDCDCIQSIHFLHAEIPFKGLKLHRCARECFESFLKAKIRFCESDIMSTRAINTIIILKLCKLKFRRIVKHPDPQCCKPFHESECKSAGPHCVPIQKSFCEKPHDSCDCKPPSDDHDCKPHHGKECKPPSHKPDCKPHDSCDCKPPSDDHDCKPHHDKECKPPSHKPDCKPHDSCDCKPPSDDHDCKPHHGKECKPHDSCDCKPPSDDHDCKPHHGKECKPHDSCDCKPPSDDHDCKPHHSKECKPPSHKPDCMPHYSGYCKPPTYDDYAYKSHPGGDCKPYEYVSSDDFHVPTYVQPCKRMGNSHGVAFGFNYED